jgi:hypothetical protein
MMFCGFQSVLSTPLLKIYTWMQRQGQNTTEKKNTNIWLFNQGASAGGRSCWYFAIFSSAVPSQDSPFITAAFQFGRWHHFLKSDGFVIGSLIVNCFFFSCCLRAVVVLGCFAAA